MSTLTAQKIQVFTMAKAKEIEIPSVLRVLEDKESVDIKKQGIFRVITAKDGDKRLVWNRMNLPEIEASRAMFNQMVAEGMVPYRVRRDGQRSADVMREFDPYAEEIIFAPIQALSGG